MLGAACSICVGLGVCGNFCGRGCGSVFGSVCEGRGSLLKMSFAKEERSRVPLSRQAYGLKAIMYLEMFNVEWTGHEEANCEDARVVLCLLGDF